MATETVFTLDDSDLLVLSILAYRLDRMGGVEEGCKLSCISQGIRQVLLEQQIQRDVSSRSNASQQMSYREWYSVLDYVDTHAKLADLEVAACTIDALGSKMMMLVDDWGAAYAVFSGTGAGEWKDNVEAACNTASAQQLAACKWIMDKRAALRLGPVVACGHSKGGNKAIFAAVRLGNAIKRAVAFDAQGFSREFVQEFGKEILENTEKITQYSLDNDYVNGFLTCVALHSQRIYLDGSHVESPLAYHSPYAMFAPYHGSNGIVLELSSSTRQGEFGKAFKEFSAYVQDNASESDYRQICTFLGAAMENILAPYKSDGEQSQRSIELGSGDGFALFLHYLGAFFASKNYKIGPQDIIAFLLPAGKRGSTVVDDLVIGALKTVGSILKSVTK